MDLENKRAYELDGLTLQGYQQVVVRMMLYMAMQHAIQELFYMNEATNYGGFSFQPMDLNDEENYAHEIDTIMCYKSYMVKLEKECNIMFAFDPGGWGGKMLMVLWTICIWPFDPGGYMRICRFSC